MPWAPKVHGPRLWRLKKRRPPAEHRPSAAKRGYGRLWRRCRRAFLAGHPLCERCGRPAQDVDHRRAVSGPDDPAFWEEENWVALCHGCHSAKTCRTDGGFGRRRSGAGEIV